MFDFVLRQMRALVREERYFVTPHSDDELVADDLTIFDVEHCVLTVRIVERQRDPELDLWKYVIEGSAIAGSAMVTVAAFGARGKLVIITAFAL